jgi:cobalt/nickel transport system ATP-binding protein
VFYDDALLERANLHPPTTVRIVRDVGLDDRSRPVTRADLVALLADGGGDAVGRETSRIDHADRR